MATHRPPFPRTTQDEPVQTDETLGALPGGTNLVRREEAIPKITEAQAPTVAIKSLVDEVRKGLSNSMQGVSGRHIFAGVIVATMGKLIAQDLTENRLKSEGETPVLVVDPEQTRSDAPRRLATEKLSHTHEEFLQIFADFSEAGIAIEEIDREAVAQEKAMRGAITDFSRLHRDQVLELLHRGRVYGKHFPVELRNELMERLKQLGFTELTEKEQEELERKAAYAVAGNVVDVPSENARREGIAGITESKEAALQWLDEANIFHLECDKALRLFVLEGLEKRGISLSPAEKAEPSQSAVQRISAKIAALHGDFEETSVRFLKPVSTSHKSGLKRLGLFGRNFHKSKKIRAGVLEKLKEVAYRDVEPKFIPVVVQLLVDGLQKNDFILKPEEIDQMIAIEEISRVEDKTRYALDVLAFTNVNQVIHMVGEAWIEWRDSMDVVRLLILDELQHMGFDLPPSPIQFYDHELKKTQSKTTRLQLTKIERQELRDWFQSRSRFEIVADLLDREIRREGIGFDEDEFREWPLILRALRRYGIIFNSLEKEVFDGDYLDRDALDEKKDRRRKIFEDEKLRHQSVVDRFKSRRTSRKQGLLPEIEESFWGVLEAAFNAGTWYHPGLFWADVRRKLEGNSQAPWTPHKMHLAGTEPQVVHYDEANDRYLFTEIDLAQGEREATPPR